MKKVKLEELPECPFCGGFPELEGEDSYQVAFCENKKCPIFQLKIPLRKWVERPVENLLRALIKQLKKKDFDVDAESEDFKPVAVKQTKSVNARVKPKKPKSAVSAPQTKEMIIYNLKKICEDSLSIDSEEDDSFFELEEEKKLDYFDEINNL